MLIDTHCHINFNHYKNDADETVKRSLEKDIHMIVVGAQYSTSSRAVMYAQKYPQGVYAAVGLHPIHLVDSEYEENGEIIQSSGEVFDTTAYNALAQNTCVVALGEMGLDYFHVPAHTPLSDIKRAQEEVFRQGLALAQELDLPMIIHARPSSRVSNDAYDDTLTVLHDVGYARCVMHSFAGSKELAKKFLDKGCMISFTGVITFKNARELQEVVKYVPINYIMTETDAPYLTPEPHRGGRNEPAYVAHVAQRIAELKGITVEEVSKVTYQNAKKFFNLT